MRHPALLKRSDFLWLLPTGLALGAVLGLLGPGAFLPGFLAFSLLSITGLLILKVGWRLGRGGKTLAWVLALAFALRLGLGVGAYVLEPLIGYDNETNRAGYLFTDAFVRDGQAWELAQSPNSLLTAFDEKLLSDQYGGLLWVSALLYRYLSPDAHRPLLVTLLAAWFGALGVAFVWATAKRLSGESSARVAAIVFAFYPESILQGAAQMREPFLMTFVAVAFYGLVEWQALQNSEVSKSYPDDKKQFAKTSEFYSPWLWMALALAGMFLVSPGFILVTLVVSGGWLYFSEDRSLPWQVILVALGVFVVAFIALSLSWESLVAVQGGGPLGVVGNWARETVKWNQQLLKSGSGIVQLVFENVPAVLHLPFVAVYGLLQPVLPAVVFEPSVPFWQILGTLRSLGWYALLPVLAYAPFAASGIDGLEKRRWLWLALAVWAWALIASLRGGADQWDNPRYRVILLAWQALVAAQVFLLLKQGRGRWLLRILVVEAVLLVVFTHWYMYRYLGIGFNIGIRNTLALALGVSTLLVVCDWVVEKLRQKRNRPQSTDP